MVSRSASDAVQERSDAHGVVRFDSETSPDLVRVFACQHHSTPHLAMITE